MIHFPSFCWHQVTKLKPPLGHSLSARPIVPGFAFFCRRSWGRPGGNSGLKDGHRRVVRHRDGINSLDHHLHVLPHTASLAQPLNSFQKRKAASCQNSWTSKAAESSRDSCLKGGGRKITALNVNYVTLEELVSRKWLWRYFEIHNSE